MGRDPQLGRFEGLYEREYVAFVRVARAIVGDRDLAVDAVHDGFAAAIRGRDGFRGDGPFEAWVWRAVVNAARKARRAERREPRAAWAKPAADFGDQPPSSDLSSVLRELPERQRLIVFLRYYADLDYRSIAAALDVQVG